MSSDLLPLFLGTAFAYLGLSALRLARGGPGAAATWLRLCLAGFFSALLEWYVLPAAGQAREANDLLGSVLALLALAAWLEFARHATGRRFGWGPVAQTLAGLAVAAVGVADLGLAEGGIYDRLIFAQRTLGLALGGVALRLAVPPAEQGAPWVARAGLALLAGTALALAAPGPWALAAASALAGLGLRIADITRLAGQRRLLVAWTAAEIVVLAGLLAAATGGSANRGREVMQLESRRLLGLAEAAAAAIEPQTVAALSAGPRDLKTQEFASLSRRLRAIQAIAVAGTNPDQSSRFAYLMALRDGVVVFLADEPEDPENPITPGDPYDEASPELRESFSTGRAFVEGPLPDRFGIWVSAFAPVLGPEGKPLAMLGIDFDASDWEAIELAARASTILKWALLIIVALSMFSSVGLAVDAQARLRESEQMFRTAADHTATWEYWVGPDGRMIYTSPACQQITGYPAAHFARYPHSVLALVHPDDRERFAEHVRACARDAPAGDFDFKIIRKDGRTAWVNHSCQSVYASDGQWNGRRASNRDITALRRAEAALARQERLQEGCTRAVRRLLGPNAATNLREALGTAGEAADCRFVGLFELRPGNKLDLKVSWPAGTGALDGDVEWARFSARALPVLAAGEVFELLPQDTADWPGTIHQARAALFPCKRAGTLHGVLAFVAPAGRDSWSRAELAAFGTLAATVALALEPARAA